MPIEIGDPPGQRYEPIEALVDTGATYTTVPSPLLERLGVIPHARDTFVLADGRRTEREVGRTWVRIDGRAERTLVVFGDPDAPVLLGAYTLEGLRLAAEVSRRLISVPRLLLLAAASVPGNGPERRIRPPVGTDQIPVRAALRPKRKFRGRVRP